MFLQRSVLLWCFCLSLSMGFPLGAADLRLPAEGGATGLFVAEVQLTPTDDQAVRVLFEPAQLQYAGAVIPHPDVQLVRDGMVELATGSTPRTFSLKFLFLPPHERSVLTFQGKGEPVRVPVSLAPPEQKKSYHLHILGVALLLLVTGFFLWKYQSRKVDLMSTRSLFLNYEELEKLRREHFGDSAPGPEKAEQGEKAVHEVLPLEPKPPEPDPVKEGGSLPSVEIIPPEEKKAMPDRSSAENPPEEKGANSDAVCPGVSVSRQPSEADTKVDEISTQQVAVVSPEQLLRPLTIILTDVRGQSFSGEGVEVLIGRKKDCQLVLTASEVSRNHVCIRRRGLGFEVVPLSSTNLTRVNETEVKTPLPLASGDKLNLGGSVFLVEIKG